MLGGSRVERIPLPFHESTVAIPHRFLVSKNLDQDVVCGAYSIHRWTVLSPSHAGDDVIAVARHPEVAEVNANGFTKATTTTISSFSSSSSSGSSVVIK